MSALGRATQFCLVGKPILRRYFRVDSCIGSVNVALKVMNRFGIKAVPRATRTFLFNAAMVEEMGRRGPDAAAQPMSSYPPECWSVGLGHLDEKTEPGKWNGHLIAIVADSVLLDPSLDQAARPERGLDVTGFAAPLPEDWRTTPTLELRNDDGMQLLYQLTPQDLSYRFTPDWQREYNEIVAEIVRAMRGDRGDGGVAARARAEGADTADRGHDRGPVQRRARPVAADR